MRRYVIGFAILLGVLLFATVADAESPGPITVDGVEYEATKVSGPAVHYETPDTNPTSAFTGRHVWTGHGGDNLPCEGGIHWIDNENVLTVSHCLPGTTTPPSTTTTTHPTTTSSVPRSTTTTVPLTTTTTESGVTTTTLSVVSTIIMVQPTTTIPGESSTAPPSTLPYTGPVEDAALLSLLAFGLLSLGTLLVRGARS